MKSHSLVHIALGAIPALLFLTGCPGSKPEELCEGGWPTCQSGWPYKCTNWAGVTRGECHVSSLDADYWCAGFGGGSAVEIDCGDYETGDEGADDGGSLNYTEYVSNPASGTYEIDYALVSQIDGDFSILESDSTTLVPSGTDDYFMLSGVASGDLADILGLQSGDILLSINSYSLDGIEDVVTAFSAVQNDSTLVLSFERSSTGHQHIYYIVSE